MAHNIRSILSLSLHHNYITTYYSNILIAVSIIVYIVLKIDIIACVVNILFTKLYYMFLLIVINMCIIINKLVLLELNILRIVNKFISKLIIY